MRLPRLLVATEREYRANLAGLNTFFGATLGFVITGIERLDTPHFAALLIVCSGIVMCILYVSNSHNRWFYVALSALLIALLPRAMSDMSLPPKLQVTFAVWLLLTVITELAPRRKDEKEPPA
jgi:hypothetical protein